MSEVTRILSAIEQGDPHAARVVALHHFAGMGHEQVAAVLGPPFPSGVVDEDAAHGLGRRRA